MAEHNIPINVTDHLVKLISSIKLEPNNLSKLTCDRTKCTSIINNVIIGATGFDDLVQYIKNNKFSLLVDESTDISAVKNLALVVRVCDNYKVDDQFLTLLSIANATANNIYQVITNFFNSHNIPYKSNLIGFAADGANTMMGNNHSLKSLLINYIPQLFVLKCVCHSLALCAEYACRKLPDEIEKMLRDIYTYFSHSFKRQHEFEQFQHFFDVKHHKLLQLSCTRWLSLLMVVRRVLQQYVPLCSYFQLQHFDGISNSQVISNALDNPVNKMYLEFLEFILPTLVDLNLEFQAETPKIYLLYSRLISTYKFILQCYIKPEILSSTKIEQLQYRNPSNYVSTTNLYIGPKLAVSLAQNVLSNDQKSSFLTNCLNFYVTCAHQMFTRFPFHSKEIIALKYLSFLDPTNIESIPTLGHVSVNFPAFISDVNALDMEWRMLKTNTLDLSLNVFVFWKKISFIDKK